MYNVRRCQMNIFYLDPNPIHCAKMHNDKHVVKMTVESAQMLSTAHRVLDGTLVNKKYIFLDSRENEFYKATHVNNTLCKWVRESDMNYTWLYELFNALCKEYTFRFDKIHKSSNLLGVLSVLPENIKKGDLTDSPLVMPSKYVLHDVVSSYRNYYGSKPMKMNFTRRNIPEWLV